ncbi:poly-(ADP-ribose) polymerase [Asbolus verrucosus]|uniref:NAD(+) ADP-ribosyltransferase n=1 Tax=Asbolus verrucosus TaxID=1661398 RepID=A0A482VEE4_ASBVE|nr:poly-(ADP-ribose) polymerase [Asbolus verrucosus]
MDLPYCAEYAKSGRSNCRGCKSPIAQGSLRLAVMVQISFQSPVHDGKVPNWYHFMCFFSKQRPKSEDDIHHFESLRIEDQNKIREKLTNVSSLIVPEKKGKGKKRDASAVAAKKAALGDFKMEYAKSGRATCRGCEQKIMKEEVRISKKDFETEVGRKYGGQDMWHHLTCFAKLRAELGYFESADKLPGFKTLSKNDQSEAKKQLPPIKQEDIPDVKKVKSEDTIDGFTEEESKLYEEQNKLMFKYRDLLEKNLNKNELTKLLEENGQEIPAGVDRILDRLADIITFGALLPCTVCKRGQLVFDKFGYKCRGNLTEWTKCNTIEREPKRKPFTVPLEFAEQYSFLKKYKYVPRTRVIKKGQIPTNGNDVKTEENAQPKVARASPALYNMEFVILGQPQRGKDELKKQISKLGGKVITKISGTVMAVIASEADVEKMGARMRLVQENRVHVVPEEFVDEAAEHVGKIPELVIEKAICDWGSDPNTRLPPEPSTSKSKSGSIYTSSMPSKVKLTLKGGTAVDPDSGLEDVAHVYTYASEKYTVVLSKTDIQTKKNSYYKIQLLEADKGSRFWVFRSWGRIGTTIGSNKLEKFDSLYDARTSFMQNYEEKTGNSWDDRHVFQKVPGLFYPIDIDYGDDNQAQSMDIVESSSKLPLPVQDLIKIIFDVNAMKKVMLEFELDTEKMPLGKLSKKQIQSAFSVLTELQQLVDNNGAEARFIDASNRFYTFIPHSFGVDDPPVLRDAEVIKVKYDKSY